MSDETSLLAVRRFLHALKINNLNLRVENVRITVLDRDVFVQLN